MPVNINQLLKDKILFLDGAMGTMLMRYGYSQGCPELINVEHPEVVKKIHQDYIKAGSSIIETNTFGGNSIKLGEWGLADRMEELNTAGVKLAMEASSGKALVAASIGPTGKLIMPVGEFPFEEAYKAFYDQIKAVYNAGADIILIETMSVLNEARAAVLAAKDAADLPIFCSMTFDSSGRSLSGTDVTTAAVVLSSLGVDVVGINCTLGPDEMVPLVEEMVRSSKVPVFVQPNAGSPELVNNVIQYPVTPKEFSKGCKALTQLGVSIIGGCCGTTPEYISEIVQSGVGKKHINTQNYTAVASGMRTVFIGEKMPLTLIGERINTTGRDDLTKAIKDGDIDTVVQEGLDQVKMGVDVLDVNVGVHGINESEVLKDVVQQLQGMVRVPLCIDSVNSNAFEGALRIYQGKAIVNSVNGENVRLEKMLPIVKKYGAAVIGLTLDENGIPEKAEDRLKIAERIIEYAAKYGISRDDILIDCLAMAAGYKQDYVMETIKAIKLVKERLAVKTVLGISNVSFGLPKRQLLNEAFVAMAVGAGLDAAIINPMDKRCIQIIRASEVLISRDVGAKRYISYYK